MTDEVTELHVERTRRLASAQDACPSDIVEMVLADIKSGKTKADHVVIVIISENSVSLVNGGSSNATTVIGALQIASLKMTRFISGLKLL